MKVRLRSGLERRLARAFGHSDFTNQPPEEATLKSIGVVLATAALAFTPAVAGAKTKHVPCGKHKPHHTNCGKHKAKGHRK